MNKSSGFSRILCAGALALISLINATGTARAQSVSTWQWRSLTPAASQAGPAPNARRNGVAIYDPVGKRLIIFSGVSTSGFVNDTWAFDLASRVWTRLNTVGTPPPPRLGFDAVYDPVGHQMLIYAGQGAGFFNDTWTLNLTTLEWRNVSPPSSARPKARYGQASIFDPVTRSLVQFAGFTEESRRFQDTQAFSLATNSWQDWTPAGAKPEIRCLLTAAFDRANRRMIIYGGQRSGFLDDVWAFDLATRTWTNLTPTQRPPGRWFSSSFVNADGQFVVFGGQAASGNVNEVWSFDLAARSWTKLEIANPPAERNGAQAAYVEGEDRFIIFGGSGNAGLLNDVWELSRRPVATVTTVSAASFAGAAFAAESIVAGFGTNLATGTQAANTPPLPTTLAGTNIKIKDSAGTERNAPLFFASPTQINFLIPAGTVSGAATLTLTSGDGAIATSTLPITNVAPSLFSANASGQGLAAAVALRVRANGTQVTEPIAQWDAAQQRFVAVPIDLSVEGEQVFLIFFGTGFRNRSSLSSAIVGLGGTNAPVTFAGAQGDFVGLDQLNVGLARSLIGRGEIEVTLMVDGQAANTVRVNIK